MNQKTPGVINVSLPVSEFVDRYLISELKFNKFIHAGQTQVSQLKSWIDSHKEDFENIVDYSSNVKAATESLSNVHSQLWDLEDLVRSKEAEQLEYFAKIAKQIFALNTDRHKLKHAIDQELPSLSFGPRLYDKGIE